MITLFVEEYNPLTPNFYNKIINQLQFHQLTCTCGHSGCLSVHGYYHRSIKTPIGKSKFRICRVICSCCGHTHAILLSSMVPYSQIPLDAHISVLSDFENDNISAETLNNNPSVDESNLRHIIRQYVKHWKQRLTSAEITFSHKLVSSCFSHYHRQFMQIKSTSNILFFNTT